ncbi:MAG: uracil-DNA glycosylase [Crocinitomicaceae bacterium]|nr:uracil-DNA glycosylase [Crocinitomicaceae bacterium]
MEDEYGNNEISTFPKKKEIFRAFEACSFEKTKVVILGQDPYPTKGHAHGLCFSVEPDVRPLPKSLKNVFKELEEDLGIPISQDGDLNRWAEQGVLLMNSVLTVSEGQPDSHKGKGWELFTNAVIQALNDKKEDVVYLLWGSKAIKKAENVDPIKNLILQSPHPSPLSAYRGFFGCKHFSKTNEYLLKKGFQEIDW